MPPIQTLQDTLGYRFSDLALLQLALTHPSVAHEFGGASQHNQRLEFLGDAVLQLVLTAELYNKFPDFGEGPLTKARAQMVNRTTLANQGRSLNLGEFLILSRGEELSGGRIRNSTLADAFEAVIGAVYLDGGYTHVQELILRLFHEAFGELAELPNLDNPKGELQELLQENSPEPPRYELLAISGPDHCRVFESSVWHNGQELGRGLGRSKKLAEGEAATAALRILRRSSSGSSQTKSADPRASSS